LKAFAPELAARALARWRGGEAGSRLEWFGPDPSPERRATLAPLRALVLERVSWP